MRIGLINQLHGRPDGDKPPPTWESIAARAAAAETAGFDVFVFEDALLYRGEETANGVWESLSIASALAAVTSRITLGPSVVNAPYRSPALLAKIAETIDEISGGRFVLGIGAGNTPDSDYRAFGFPVDRRYSRFEEAIQIVHALLKDGRVDFRGNFHSAEEAELVLRGPRPDGLPINIAAGGPKMLKLAARYGDQWNWWAGGETLEEARHRLKPLIEQLDEACEGVGRDPVTLERTLDFYTVIPEAFSARATTEDVSIPNPVAGSAAEIAQQLLELGELGFSEIRCDVWPKTPEAILAMSETVEILQGR